MHSSDGGTPWVRPAGDRVESPTVRGGLSILDPEVMLASGAAFGPPLFRLRQLARIKLGQQRRRADQDGASLIS
jgi:hypothetical protein